MESSPLCKHWRSLDIIEAVKAARIAVSVALLTTLLFSEKHFSPPTANHARTYALHETHDDEKVTVAVQPCDTPETAGVFKTNFRSYGFYPMRLMVSNDSDTTLMLQDLKIQYITARREKLQPATNADIFRRLVKPSRTDQGKPGMRLPFPVGKKKEPISKEVREEYESAQFLTVPVTPHATNSGYLFFDMLDAAPEPGAHLYISGIKAGTKELFYFDIPMDKPVTSEGPSR
jgi:hypothetical protein